MRRNIRPADASTLLAARRNQWRFGLVLMGLVVLAITAWHVSRLRSSIEREALALTEVHARVLEGHVSQVVGATANVLHALADDPLVQAQPLDAAAVARLLAQRLPGQPYLRSVSLLDPTGRVLASTTAGNTGRSIDLLRLGDAAKADDRARLGPLLPVRDLGELAAHAGPSRAAAAWPMVRSVRSTKGPARWLVVLVNVDYFSTQHALITRGEPVRALLLGLDGTLVSSTGDDAQAPGTALPAGPPLAGIAGRSDSGAYIGAGSDGQRVAASYRSARQWPLLLVAETPYRVVQAQWRSQLGVAGGVTLALLTLLAGLGALAERGARRELQALAELDQLNQEVARTEQRWKLALDGAGHGVWDADLATRTADVSARLMSLLGHPGQAEVWSLARWLALVHPDDQAPALAAARRHLDGETSSLETELRMRCADGSWKWVLARGTRSGRADAAGLGTRLVGTVTDISASKAAEAALRASDARQQAILRSALDAIVTVNVEGHVVDFNPAAERMFGHRAEQALGRPMQALIVPHHHRQAHEAGMARYQATGVAHVLNRRIETEALRADGTLFPVELTIVPVHTDAGEFFTATLRDITERLRVEAELQNARQRELVIGARIQQALLVDAPDQRLPGLWLSTLNQASQGIDGDFVELISLGERGVDIIVGDVMGKGVAAALMAAGTKMQFSRCVASLLADLEREGDLPSPAEVVAAVHQAMTANLQSLEAFVTLSYLRLDMLAGTITWVGCGHEEPLLLRGDGSLHSLANQHPPLGVLDAGDYQQDVVSFAEGDALFLCSDGAADALMPDGSRLGRERVTAMVVALMRQLRTPAAVLHSLRRELAATGARITDDLTLALALAAGPTALASRRELPAELKALRHVSELVGNRCLQAGLGEVETGLFAVACVEAYTNAVRHTRGRPADAPVELVVRVEPGAVVVEFVTLGEPFELPARSGEIDYAEFPEGGFGLSIMRQASDHLEYRHDAGVNTVRLTRRRSAPG